ncbi:helix-turn-helix domain-containing protein [Nocardiopsis changdeensis]|uniref:helix-turn-helix domain-containing protein n=1 Tax=Nocardiopsis TaxID=2013 RepID=UPI001C72CAD0|nr:helix-turn-helix domain-containing protein [Nocardiopsis sp. MT53]QYX37399.1 helix-turn-helix domain-containing protein [Nocardiopsis sp. MT53]
MATIGHTLSAARVAAGLTVADLSVRTRIREPVLRAIEEEDFVPCGGDFYARGHIRGLCRALRLDPAPLLEEFDREHAGRRGSVFVPPPRHPAAVPAAARAAAAARTGGATGEEPAEAEDPPMAGPRVIGEDTEPGAGPERWNHFERGDRLRRGVRGTGPRRRRPAPEAAAPAAAGGGRRERGAAVPAPRDGRDRPAGRRRRPAPADCPAPRPPVTRTASGRAEAVRRHWPWALVALLVVLSIVIGVRTWQDWDGEPLRTAFEGTGTDTVDSAVLPEAPGTGEGAGKQQGGDDPARAGKADEVTVGLTASSRTWVKVTDAGGENLFTGFLAAGEARDYVTDDTLTLWLGNAGGVEVTVDGEDLGTAGSSGEVKEVVVGADGFDG